MRLIDADALKEAFKKKCCCEISLDLIDNAPTVETTKVEHKAYNEGFKDGVDQGIKLSERPHGEWITSKIDGEKYNCSECGGSCWYYDYQGNVSKSNFCPNCGSDMRCE